MGGIPISEAQRVAAAPCRRRRERGFGWRIFLSAEGAAGRVGWRTRWREACWAVQKADEAVRSSGGGREGIFRGGQGGSRGVGMRKGAAMLVGLNDERGRSGWTTQMACTVDGSALGRAGGGEERREELPGKSRGAQRADRAVLTG